ncbi:MAG: exodeoxyribonuclease VII small subunit [Candidatus Omnitrophica bacterium]|nr:exodeoxyribonuclease VII small subunit [Candidatus Omnitrophota bacterium]
MAEMKFEEAIKKLEGIVEKLENGDLPLEDSLAKYEEGIKLSRICQKKLVVAKKKVEILVKGKDGKLKLESFEDEESPKKKSKNKDVETLF